MFARFAVPMAPPLMCSIIPPFGLQEEKEVVQKHRLSADLLAQLSDKVRGVANAAMEREERALKAMERDVADRETRVASREKVLQEREAKVGGAAYVPMSCAHVILEEVI